MATMNGFATDKNKMRKSGSMPALNEEDPVVMGITGSVASLNDYTDKVSSAFYVPSS